MEGNGSPVSRIRKVDWREVIRLLDEAPVGTAFMVGVMDQSIRTHLKNGRVKYLDPAKYEIWTETSHVAGSRHMARLYMKRKA